MSATARRRWRWAGSTSAPARSIARKRAIAARRRADVRRGRGERALYGSACGCRRDRRFAEAADVGGELVALTEPRLRRRRHARPPLRQFAVEALAIHHEHRERDLAAARELACSRCEEAGEGRGRPPSRGRLSPPARAARAKLAEMPIARKQKTLSSFGAERPSKPRLLATPWPLPAAGCFLAFAAALRLSDVCAPNRFVNRSTRPSVSISFCRPVKNGWQLLQISRCSSGLVERVVQRRAARAAGNDLVVLRVNPFLHCRLLRGSGKRSLYQTRHALVALQYLAKSLVFARSLTVYSKSDRSAPSGASCSSAMKPPAAPAVADARCSARRARASACPG